MASAYRSFFVCLLVIWPLVVGGEIYKWVDENGKVHFSDTKPESQPVETVELRINTINSVRVDPVDQRREQATTRRVVMYSTEWCGVCKKAKRYFRDNGIAFTEYDIEKSSAARSRFNRYGGQGVPLILVGEKKMHGFSAARFRRLYEGV